VFNQLRKLRRAVFLGIAAGWLRYISGLQASRCSSPGLAKGLLPGLLLFSQNLAVVGPLPAQQTRCCCATCLNDQWADCTGMKVLQTLMQTQTGSTGMALKAWTALSVLHMVLP